MNFPLNDQILNLIKVPTAQFSEKAGKAPEDSPDYLFILTADLSVVLLVFHPTQGITLMSSGNIVD